MKKSVRKNNGVQVSILIWGMLLSSCGSSVGFRIDKNHSKGSHEITSISEDESLGNTTSQADSSTDSNCCSDSESQNSDPENSTQTTGNPFSSQPGTMNTQGEDDEKEEPKLNLNCRHPSLANPYPLTFEAATPFSLVVIDTGPWDYKKKPFTRDSFMEDPHWMCLDGNGGRTKVPHNYLQYSTQETAEYLACVLGADRVEESYPGGIYCTSETPGYQIVFETENNKIRLSAGLVANTFNRNPQQIALLMIRTEIARSFGRSVPSWEQTANSWNCGGSALGIVTLTDPEEIEKHCK